MSQLIRKVHNIPDSYVKDTHLTNWLSANLSNNIVAVFSEDKETRGTLTKKGVTLGMGTIIICTKDGNCLEVTTSEWTTLVKR